MGILGYQGCPDFLGFNAPEQGTKGHDQLGGGRALVLDEVDHEDGAPAATASITVKGNLAVLLLKGVQVVLDLLLSHARFKGDAAGGRVQDSKVVRVGRREQVDVQKLPGGRHGFDVGISPERPAYGAEGCRRPPSAG